MSTSPSPFVDHAEPILRNAPIPDSLKGDLWQAFHESKDPEELVQRLQPLVVPDQVKTDLYEKKKFLQPSGSVDTAVSALTKMRDLPPEVLDLAEAHPKIASLLVSAASKGGEKGPEKPAASAKPAAGPKPSPAAPGAPADDSASPDLSEMPPDVPPTPSGQMKAEVGKPEQESLPLEKPKPPKQLTGPARPSPKGNQERSVKDLSPGLKTLLSPGPKAKR
jgi:hypothetical protein